MAQRTLKICLTALLTFFAAPAFAHAGRYHVFSCRTPNGNVAPTDGWSGSLAPGGAFDDYVTNSCASGGALVAALGDETTHLAYTDRSTWQFSPPSAATLNAATLWRAGYVHGRPGEEAAYDFWLAGPLIKNVFEECVYVQCHGRGEPAEVARGVNSVTVPAKNLGSHLFLSTSCGAGLEGSECGSGFTDSNNYAAALYLYAADLTLEQAAGPTVSSVGGELASAPETTGVSDVTFTASDPGAGVYEAVFEVDGKITQTSPLDEAGGHCRDVGQTTDGLPAFLYLQPCPATVSADVGFDSAGLGPGAHHLIVSVLDAAGNSAPVLDRTITVPTPPGPLASPSLPGAAVTGGVNGVAAGYAAVLTARWRNTTRTRLATRFGASETITGRLTDPGGTPIAAASIAVSSTPSFAGAASAAMKGTQTGADGTFALRLPSGLSSRTIVLAYTAHPAEPRPSATAALQLAVAAPVSLTIVPRTASSLGTIHFRGRLMAGPIPRGGKPVILEARSGRGAWIEFHVARTNSHGRFSSSYRFRFPGPARYAFRAVCEQEADYPFAAGISRVIPVHER